MSDIPIGRRHPWATLWLGVVLTLLVAGCGGHGGQGGYSGPQARGTSSQSTSPRQPTIPVGFPLARGLVADSETTVSRPRRHVRGIDLPGRCGGAVWPGSSVDRLVVEQVGPELGVTRELAVYRDAAAARAVVGKVRVAVTRCGRSATTFGDRDGGRPGAALRFARTLPAGRPGGSVYVLTQVGRAVLAVQDSGEWTRATAGGGLRHLERSDRGVVVRMCVFTDAGCDRHSAG